VRLPRGDGTRSRISYPEALHMLSLVLNRMSAVFAALSIVLALTGVGCGGASTDTTDAATADDGSGISFGKGEVPATVPASFPIPDEAVVGTTLVDANRGLTEMVLTFPASLSAVVTYYEENLPSRGYEISASDGSGSQWGIEFEGDGVSGTIAINAEGNGISSAAVQLTST